MVINSGRANSKIHQSALSNPADQYYALFSKVWIEEIESTSSFALTMALA
jgi:hypothetical protein